MIIVVTGVSGSGKTSVGRALARRLGWEFADADQFHSEDDKRKMRAGRALTTEERIPWLCGIRDWIDDHLAAGTPGVVTCSALKRSYRELIGEGRPGVRLVYLDADKELVARRLAARKDHFFPAGLLDSQFRALEPPRPDENVLKVPATGPVPKTVDLIVNGLDLG